MSEMGDAFAELLVKHGAPMAEATIVAEASATLLEDDMPVGHDDSMIGLAVVGSGYSAARPANPDDPPESHGKWIITVDKQENVWMSMHLMDRESAEMLYRDLGEVLYGQES